MSFVVMQVVSSWQTIVGVFLLLVVGTEVGYQIRRRLPPPDDYARTQLTTVQAAIYGFLALLLSFTFSMATTRFESRKALMIDESNAIETVFLRADVLPDKFRADMKLLLHDYLRIRLEFFQWKGDVKEIETADANGVAQRDKIWAMTARIGREYLNAEMISLFAGAVGEMITINNTQRAAAENHVPTAIWLLICLVGAFGVLTTGLTNGAARRRDVLDFVLMPLLIALVMAIIIDIDYPRMGTIRIGQGALTRLQARMEATE